MIKKIVVPFFLVIMVIFCYACDSEKSNVDNLAIGTEDEDSKDNINYENQDDVEGNETPSDVEPIYLKISGWQDNMIFGWSENTKSVFDTQGNKLFDILDEEDQSFVESFHDGKDTKVFYGDYTILDDDTVINRKGETVFDLSKTEFEDIYYYECLDVGYLLCSKNVDTFEETGKHYFAVNITDGSYYQFEGEMKPMSAECYYYFGDGIFIYSKHNSGFGTNHTFYNILNKEEYKGYAINDKNEKVYEYLPDLYFYGGFKNDITTKPTVDKHFYAINKEYIVDYDVSTGFCKKIDIRNIINESYFKKDDTRFPYIYEIIYTGEEYLDDKGYLNIKTGKFTDMGEYEDCFIWYYKEGFGYLAQVENEGGGRFVTVISEEGDRVFEPIDYSTMEFYSSELFGIKDDEKFIIYNWEGEIITTLDNAQEGVTAGNKSFITSIVTDDKNEYVLHTVEGKEININKKVDFRIENVLGFVDGVYIFENMLVNEDGEVILLQVN